MVCFRSALVVGIIILAGCAPSARPYWINPAYTPQLWARDS